jgi:thioredoxin-like negative regulator of GroEL
MKTQKKTPNGFSSRLPRLLFLTAAMFGCLLGIWTSGRNGVSSLLSTYGTTANMTAAADEAIRICPRDPNARVSRAAVLMNLGRLEEAKADLETATTLRPRDYEVWKELGRLCDLTNDVTKAKAAFRQAVQLAPYYAKPRWQLGNVLLREGVTEEAFEELRHAAERDQSLKPNLVDLAWGAFDGDAAAIERALGFNSDAARVQLASLFIKRGKKAEAVQLLHELGAISDRDRIRLMGEMLDAKFFREAAEFRRLGNHSRVEQRNTSSAGQLMMTDGGFEKSLNPTEKGFGWRSLPKSTTLNITQDVIQRRTERASMRFEWNGDVDASTALAWQVVMVEPNHRYTLSFAAKTAELVSGALPEVMVVSAQDEKTALTKPMTLTGGNNEWKLYTTEFVAGADTEAVRVVIQRQSCAMLPCPIFGKTWFDDFSLTSTDQN